MIRLHNRNLLAAILAGSALIGLLLLVIHGWLTIVLGVVYAILLPGFMGLAAIRGVIRFTWPTLIYSLAFGIVSFTFLALTVNGIGLLLHSTAPLTLENLVVANFAFLGLLAIPYKRWDIQIAAHHTRLNRIEIGVLGASLLLATASIIGAVILNNGQSGLLSFLVFLAIPLLLVFLFWKNKSMRSGVTATSLWLIAIALLLSGWLRSWYISGPDVSLEYKLAEMVTSANIWSLETIKHAYNACLSVSLFAPALSIITKTSLVLVFKFIVPILYSAVVPIVYLLTKRYLSERGGIVGAAFFIAQPVFVVWWWIPLRQQIAFLLFGAILLLITEYKARDRRTLSLLLLLSLGLVVAHYTTALIAIAYFVTVWLTAVLLSKNKRFTSLKSPVPPVIIVLLIAAYFVWYAQLTYGFNGVTQFIAKSFGGISSLVTHEKQENEEKKPFDILTALSSTPSPPTLEAYSEKRVTNIRNAYGEKNMYDLAETQNYPSSLAPLPNEENGVLQTIRQGFISLSKLLIVVSVIAVVWRAVRDGNLRRYAALALGGLATLVLTIALPSFSASYDVVRTYQQLLFVMASLFILVILAPKRWQKLANISAISFVAVYFVLTSHTLSFLDSSPSVPANLANTGTEFTYRYVNASDIALGQWLAQNTDAKATISGDSLARDRLRQTLDPNRSQAMLNTVIPTGLPKNGYVIQNIQANKTNSYETHESQLFSFNFPSQFLEEKKNIIYSNSGNRLFR